MKISSLHKNLVGHWPLDQESFNPSTKRFTDKSAYSNHGTGNGTQLGSADPGFQADRMGQLVRAAPFNGSDDYVDLNDEIAATKKNTFALWVKFSANQDCSILAPETGTGTVMSIRIDTDDRIQFRPSGGGGADLREEYIFNFDIDTWYHLIFVRDEQDLKVYVDSSELTGTNYYAGANLNSDYRYIGIRKSGNDFYFSGSIADVRIYNRALSEQEITQLYESYRPKVMI